MSAGDAHLAIATLADAAGIAALHTGNWQRGYRGMLPDAYLEGPLADAHRQAWRQRVAAPAPAQTLIVARLRSTASCEALAGFVFVSGAHDADAGTLIENLHVAPELLGQGLGRRLLAAAARWSERRHPGVGVHLWALAGNTPARRFYARCGGRITARGVWDSPAGVGIDEVRYAWATVPALLAGVGETQARAGHNSVHA